ncbi:resolvase [Streptomyces sp. NPDC020379]|uniref:resolvase n=1 Tax=Streptomyces sp. NPDC020379 TaxID=3365071 RepID=UPI0037A42DF8
MVQTLAASELQRDFQREPFYDGLRSAEGKGNKGGRRPAVPAGKADAVRTAHLEGRSIAALVCDHDVSRSAVRTAITDLLPEHTAADHEDTMALELPVTSICRAGSPTSYVQPSWTWSNRPCSIRASPPCPRFTSSSSAGVKPSTALRRSRGKARREYENRANALGQ